MSLGSRACEPQLLKPMCLRAYALREATREARATRSLCTATSESLCTATKTQCNQKRLKIPSDSKDVKHLNLSPTADENKKQYNHFGKQFDSFLLLNICVCVCMYVCMYIYIYIYIYDLAIPILDFSFLYDQPR